MVTEARLRANKKYIAKTYDKIDVRVPKGEKDKIKSWAESQGMSLAEYVRRACYEKAGKEI
jgi:uncharacterized protein (DUF1778 family)